MDLRNLVLRVGFGVVLAILSFAIVRLRPSRAIANLHVRRFDQLFLATFALIRIALFVVVFFVLHQHPHADLPAVYVPEAHAVLHGSVPYRDFKSSYAPLNPYLDAALLKIRDTPLSILCFQIACEIASVPFVLGFFRRFLSEWSVRKAALLYMVQPVVLWGTCVDGKNHACIALLLAIALYAVARREVLSGIACGLSFTVVKILPLMFLPALFMAASKRVIWLVSALAIPVLVYGGFALARIDVTVPLRAEGDLITAGNVPYLAAAVFGHETAPRILNIVALGLTLSAVSFAAWAQRKVEAHPQRMWKLTLSMLLVLFTVLLFTKKSDPIYISMAFFLVCALTVKEEEARPHGWTAYVYSLLSAIGLPVASFWFWPLHEATGPQLHTLMLKGNSAAVLMVAGQAVLIACYGWFSLKIIEGLRNTEHMPLMASEPRLAS